MHDHVAVEAAAENVLADEAGLTRVLDRPLQEQPLVVVLAADIDEGYVDLQRIRRDQHPSMSWCGLLSMR